VQRKIDELYPPGEWTETETAFGRFRDDRILEVRCKAGVLETLETAQYNLNLGSKLIGDNARAPMLLVLGGILGITSEARIFWAESEITAQNVSRLALVLDSYISRVIGNIFIGINKPGIPVKLFTDEEKAIAWLREAEDR
jgi:hypothetical protein